MVAASFGIGWSIGTYTNKSTEISNTAMSIGQWAEGWSGNIYVGATFAAGGAIVTSPYYVTKAVGGWLGDTVYDLFH